MDTFFINFTTVHYWFHQRIFTSNTYSQQLCLSFEIKLFLLNSHNVIFSYSQALTSMSSSPQPIHDLDSVANNPEFWRQKAAIANVSGFNPLIYGNDVDSIDVATRVAMVRNFLVIHIYVCVFVFYYFSEALVVLRNCLFTCLSVSMALLDTRV